MSSVNYLDELFGMKGQTAVVIGGAGALGRALARGLAKNGAKVVIAGRKEETGENAVAEFKKEGLDVAFHKTDATDKASLISLRDRALELTGKVDMLVNCAGANVGNSFLDVDADEWDKILAINLKGTMLSCHKNLT